MTVRSIVRQPVRSAMTTIGLAASIAVLIGAMFATGSIEEMIYVTYFQAERQDATIAFPDIAPARAIRDIERLPGVLRAEPYRAAPVRLVNGHLSERTVLFGKPAAPELSRIVDADLAPVSPPDRGLAMPEMLADLIGARPGDVVQVELLTGRRETLHVPLTTVIRQDLGLGAYMTIDALNRELREGHAIDGAHLMIDDAAIHSLYAAVKATPEISALALRDQSLNMFRETAARNVGISVVIYSTLAVVIGFGVVYNAVRVQVSEKARELASLRVLGFTKGETAAILLGELAILGLLAIPLGWALGWALAWGVIQGLQSELYRVPLIVTRATYGYATLVFLVVALASAFVARRRIDRLDLISVLKTRD